MYTYVHKCTYIDQCTYLHKDIFTCLHVYIFTYTFSHFHIYTVTHLHVCMFTFFIFTFSHIYRFTYIHTYLYTLGASWRASWPGVPLLVFLYRGVSQYTFRRTTRSRGGDSADRVVSCGCLTLFYLRRILTEQGYSSPGILGALTENKCARLMEIHEEPNKKTHGVRPHSQEWSRQTRRTNKVDNRRLRETHSSSVELKARAELDPGSTKQGSDEDTVPHHHVPRQAQR